MPKRFVAPRMRGRDIRTWRKNQYLSQTALGEILGVDYTTIANWEHERFSPPPALDVTLEAIAQSRAPLLRRLRAKKEELAHRRRLKMIEQGLRDPEIADLDQAKKVKALRLARTRQRPSRLVVSRSPRSARGTAPDASLSASA